MFARVALEAIGLMERLNLASRSLRTLAVHVALLLQMPDLATTTDKLNNALLAYKQKHHAEKD